MIPAASILKDAAFHTYRVDLGLEVWWRDRLTDLRLEFVRGADGKPPPAVVDYVEVGDLPGDVYEANNDLNVFVGDDKHPAEKPDAPQRIDSKHFVFWWSPMSTVIFDRFDPEGMAAGGGGRSAAPVRADTEPHPAVVACAHVTPLRCCRDRRTAPWSSPPGACRYAWPAFPDPFERRYKAATGAGPGSVGASRPAKKVPSPHRRIPRRVGTLLGRHDECQQPIWAIPVKCLLARGDHEAM